MREIVVTQIGQGGNHIGAKFWEFIADEHAIQPNGQYAGGNDLRLQRINVYFEDARHHRYTPRAVLIDLDQSTLEQLKHGPYGKTFCEEQFISSKKGTSNNWAKGRYTEGPSCAQAAREILRKTIERCDSLQGIQVIHALAGGTGSGLGSLVMAHIRSDYPEKVLNSFSVLPSPKISNTVVEPYNSVLSLHHLIETTDLTVLLDNDALNNICTNTLKIPSPSYGDINHLIATAMTGITATYRFPGQLNSNLRKIQVNMVPFPRLHFMSPCQVPLVARASLEKFSLTTQTLVSQMFDSKTLMVGCDPRAGRYLTAAALFRGRVSTKELDDALIKMKTRDSEYYVNWIPNNIKVSICDIPPRGYQMSATVLSNTTAIRTVLSQLKDKFTAMYKKKAFLHWYTAEGMDEVEFSEAASSLGDLIAEYQSNEADYEEQKDDDLDEEELSEGAESESSD